MLQFAAPAVTNAKRKWSAPIHIYRTSEFFLDLPSHGDVKVITDCRRKMVKITVENINYVSGYHRFFGAQDVRLLKIELP